MNGKWQRGAAPAGLPVGSDSVSDYPLTADRQPLERDCARCFHCAEPLAGSTLRARIHDRDEPVCCAGCLAVAELIAGAGLEDFYKYRCGPAERPDASALANDRWSAWSRPDVAGQFTRLAGDIESAHLLIEGLRCAACSWLIDRVVSRLPGVTGISVNAATARAHIEWRHGETDLGAVLRAIANLGYRPHPATDTTVARVQQAERRLALQRLAVSGFGMMQVMMFAVAIYAAEIAGEVMDAGILKYFRIVSLLVATPVMLYAGQPFLVSAWNSLRARSVGMDVPVSIALILAYAASVWNTLRGSGEVYFDSVTMFIFFLTLGRFVEMTARHRTTDVTDALSRHLPVTALRLQRERIEEIATTAIAVGDILLVRTGETVPVDGRIEDGETSCDEALLSGESLPTRRGAGDRVLAGAINVSHPIRIRVTAIGAATTLSTIAALLQRAQARKPGIALAADAAAARFLRYVLIGSAAVCGTWLAIDPSRAFEATLAVLVVACPCAFSIAMPAALAAATARLARRGMLVVQPDALESLAHIDRVIFDKTGTLTLGEPRLTRCTPLGAMPKAQVVAIAAALEQSSSHPIAAAFAGLATQGLHAQNVQTVPGFGVEGTIDGRRYRIGVAGYVAGLRSASIDVAGTASGHLTVLGDAEQLLGSFELADTLREDAVDAIRRLYALQLDTEILSGDSHPVVTAIARSCGIREFAARRSPEQKLARVRELQDHGKRVAMLGDGINDAPVLGGADVSIAMGRGAALAHASADMILLSDKLASLPEAICIARKAMRIAKQNLFWAGTYNLGALPLAALGFVPPWLAAIGMSLSSVAVVMNAMRCGREEGPPGRWPDRRTCGQATPQATDSRPAQSALFSGQQPSAQQPGSPLP